MSLGNCFTKFSELIDAGKRVGSLEPCMQVEAGRRWTCSIPYHVFSYQEELVVLHRWFVDRDLIDRVIECVESE